jgi:hypothetical protein
MSRVYLPSRGLSFHPWSANRKAYESLVSNRNTHSPKNVKINTFTILQVDIELLAKVNGKVLLLMLVFLVT